MSTHYRKVEFTCDCGQNYGSCEETGKFFMVYHGVSDLNNIYYQAHPGDRVIDMGCFTDEQLSKLGTLLTAQFDTLATCSAEEIKLLNFPT